MLTRTGLDVQTSRPGQHHSRNGGGSLTLLRAGCPRPAVQHLYRSEQVGLGQAMGLAEDGCSSDLDSGEIVAGRDVECHKRMGTLPTEHRQRRRAQLKRGVQPVFIPVLAFSFCRATHK